MNNNTKTILKYLAMIIMLIHILINYDLILLLLAVLVCFNSEGVDTLMKESIKNNK